MALHKDPLYLVFYFGMALVGVATVYVWLNAGSETSLVRHVAEPRYDGTLLYLLSVTFFILGFFVFQLRDQGRYRTLIEMNAEKIRGLREKGMADEDIAQAMLAALGSTKGYRHNFSKRKILALLASFR